ncbi:hypothetical protein [uncultured Alistipes sp.]|uniref:hypothetical protein n=1 Tax=uncultured Alistipes sp. TaxID=538949 RepID=UPI0026214233|nr:hypothetical protein [uncultured Alistipes sp.]
MKTRYISCLTALLLSVGMFSCNRDDAGGGPVDPEGPVGVRIVVSNGDATRSVGSEATDNEIQQLRVYAFNELGKLTGYAMSDNLQGRNYLPITLSEGGDTYFYVIANDHFGPKPTVNGTAVSDWTLLTRSDLQNLVFDLSGFTGWTVNNGESISPMSNNRYREDGSEFANKYENDFATPVDVTEDRQIIPVTVQHVLGRLRLFLYKDASLGDDYMIKLTRAAVYRRPDAFRLYYSDGNTITYTKNSDALVDEFVTSEIILDKKPANGETLLARTFLAPNIYGSGDKVGSAPASDEDKAYKLVLTIDRAYRGGGWSSKDYTVYLPPVSRNASIDVQGTISAEVDKLSFNVITNAWIDKTMNIPPFE